MNVLLSGPSLLRHSFWVFAQSPSNISAARKEDVARTKIMLAIVMTFRMHQLRSGAAANKDARDRNLGHRRSLIFQQPYLTETNGRAEPGTIVVGSTPFQRSACTRVTRFGLVPSALARASMAAASASPVIRILVALASPFSRSASALACASARTALALAVGCVHGVRGLAF